MKVVPSTYHQTVSYLTNAGQVDLLSNQLAIRQCYQLSIREQKGEKSSEPSILDSPEVGDTLYLYLAISDVSVGATLLKEDKNLKQRPVFFVSKSLSEAETRYTSLERAVLTLQYGG